MQEHHLTVTKTARYVTLGEPNEDIQQVWFVCHGYGQLAGYFIQHFAALNDGRRLIVAPEGLSRAYLSGFTGRIGASWMTKEDHLHEISDYVNYMNTLYTRIFQQIERDSVSVYVLGFSQGTATVCRWLSQGCAKADRLILWAGLVPPDLDLAASREILANSKLTLVLGTEDEYANESRVSEQEQQLKQQNIPYKLITFPGGHYLVEEILNELARP
ncbi:MAG: alpha/beta hydrolase [bacterium]